MRVGLFRALAYLRPVQIHVIINIVADLVAHKNIRDGMAEISFTHLVCVLLIVYVCECVRRACQVLSSPHKFEWPPATAAPLGPQALRIGHSDNRISCQVRIISPPSISREFAGSDRPIMVAANEESVPETIGELLASLTCT